MEPTEDECPVCLSPLKLAIRTRPPCGHEVCLLCLMRLPRAVCVICRAELSHLMPVRAGVVLVRRPPTLDIDTLLVLSRSAAPPPDDARDAR